MRDNGDDGVLEVRRGTIVKLVASDISTTNSFSLRKACDKLGLCVMMPYIASNSTSRRLDEAYGALSLVHIARPIKYDIHR